MGVRKSAQRFKEKIINKIMIANFNKTMIVNILKWRKVNMTKMMLHLAKMITMMLKITRFKYSWTI